MNTAYQSMDNLPAMLTVAQVASALNISRTSAYELAHCKNFPAMLIGSRILVPKDRLVGWINDKLACNELVG